MLRQRYLSLIAGLVQFIATSPRVLAESPDPPALQIFQCKPGPWGKVEWHHIYLEAPGWIVDQFPTPNTQTSWRFPAMTRVQLRAFLSSKAGIATKAVDGWFSDKRAILDGSEDVTVFPSADDLEQLSPSAREIIYAELARSPANPYHAEPFFILDQSIDEWLGPRKVRPEVRGLFERMTYKRGDVLAFSDLPVLMSYARDASDAQDLLKLATRIRAIMAFLTVHADDDVKGIEGYWSAGDRRKDVLPMLESVSQLPGGGRLGFVHLLPAQPRKLMYTYPTFDLATSGKLPDCHWTTLNFFNDQPENLFLDTRLATTRVLQSYRKVEPPYAFGDALFFVSKEGDTIHSCTYLCDDLVFTKNGATLGTPWVISRTGTLMRLYGPAGAVKIQGYREIVGG